MKKYNMWTGLDFDRELGTSKSFTVEEICQKVREQMDMSMEASDEQVYEWIDQVILQEMKQVRMNLGQKTKLREQVFNSLRKLDVLQELLDDEQISEIMVNGYDRIFVERDGRVMRTDKKFESRERYEDIVQQIVAKANRMVNRTMPIVDARLEDGSRVNIVLYPIALNGPIVTIRKFPKEAMSMGDLMARGALNREIEEFLKKLMIARYNIFISGGTGSG